MKTHIPHQWKLGGAVALLTLLGAASASADANNQFTIAVIPDTQNYCDIASPQPASSHIYQGEMRYLTNQMTAQNIVFVTHMGDVVQHGDLYDDEWRHAKRAMDILAAAGLPFAMTPGNHDYDNYSHPTGNRPLKGANKWNQYFGPNSSYFSGKSWFGGAFSDPASSGVSSYQTFNAGGKTFLHISLEMEASDSTLAWATGVITNHSGMPTLVSTHEYLSYQNDANGVAMRLQDGYMSGEANNQAQAVWDKFISQNDQIFLVLCGHNWSSTVNGVSDGENLRVDNNAFGHPVYQVLNDYQGNTFDSNGTPGIFTGGAGWLRLMTFDTQDRTIHFKTYSSELNEYAGVPGGPTFNLPASMSDFTLAIPDRVFSAWKFGVIDDTQWTCPSDPSGENPNQVPVSIISQINPQFISAGVKFVVQVGDLTENGNDADEAARAEAAKPLLDAGIGFFPMRGNHETYASPANSFAIPAFQANYPQTRGLTNTFDAVNFSSPTSVSTDLNGMSYSFDYNNARFVILDSWVTPSKHVAAAGYDYGYSFGDQQSWITGQLDKNVRGALHAFVFSHQPLIAENHQDSPFVGYTDANPEMQNAFLASLATNNVKYYISGHDHIHQRSIITSPDGNSKVEEIIGASDSSKFYTPKATNQANWFDQKARELSVSQERYTVGYYIYTVDGPRVTVDYYSDDHGNWGSDANYPVTTTGGDFTNQVSPIFHFVKKETFGYSLNGQSFFVAQGQTYASVSNSIAAGGGFIGTSAQILGGMNASATKDGSSRPLTKEVNTGWARNLTGLASDVLSLWGLQEVGAASADAYALSLSYDPTLVTAEQAKSGGFCLASKDVNGNWVNAVTLNNGGAPQFVLGLWNGSYPLGAYGVDTNANTVWAVVNYQGNFAATYLAPFQKASLVGPANGATVTKGIPTLSWSPVAGASGYTVALMFPGGKVVNYSVTGTTLSLSFPLTNGDYSWTVTASNSQGSGPASSSVFTLKRTPSTAKWSFGVMSDTQWTGVAADPVNNPNNVPVSIINQINPQFISAGVKFVVQVGDLTENGNPADVDVRAAAAQALYNAGIGFFPLRGNHESGQLAAARVTNDFPQTQGLGTNVMDAINFTSAFNTLAGLSYSFDYNNARFLLLDQFTRLDGSGTDANNDIVDQVSWVGITLSNRLAGTHAFVFSHKNLIGENHTDCLFGAKPSSNAVPQNQFIGALANTGVRYTMSGHDHVYQRSIITSPDTLSSIQEIICGSDSSKFYTPGATTNTGFDGQKYRETSVAQDLYRITYYIVTVDGPKVTVDYYASDETFPGGNSPNVTPTLHFSKRETFGYSLNGAEFLVPQGQSYARVQNRIAATNGFLGTTAAILGGTNGSTVNDYNSRPLTKTVDTAWSLSSGGAFSDVLTLVGLVDIAATQTDTIAISLSYNATGVTDAQIASGLFCLSTKDANGKWVNAVDKNIGGVKTFVNGPWNASYPLGTYGVDKSTGAAWAVVDYQGDFAVVQLPPSLQISTPDIKGNVNVTWPTSLLPGYVLQFNSDLNTTNWVPVNGNGFFRLVKP